MSVNPSDIANQHFGKLRAIVPMPLSPDADTDTLWLCQCDCGRTTWIKASSLTRNEQQDCGVCVTEGRIQEARLTVKGLACKRIPKNKHSALLCQCQCGNSIKVPWNSLNRGIIRSCGCYKRERDSSGLRRAQLTGKVFGHLQVVVLDHSDKRRTYWQCKCLLCGESTVVAQYRLVGGSCTSCGCLERENRKSIHTRIEPYLYGGTNIAKIRSKNPSSSNEDGVRGVHWDESNKRWVATLGYEGKRYFSYHSTFGEAVAARERMETEFFAPAIEDFEANRAEKGIRPSK